MTYIPDHYVTALKYYSGQVDTYDGMPKDNKAYNTLNSLFYCDTISERARVKEGKRLNLDFFDEKSILAIPTLCADLITATLLGGDSAPAQILFRVSRHSDVDAMKLAGKTLSFTSTSKKKYLKTYADKDGLILLEIHLPANAPRADFGALITDYSKPEEAEVLLPPWLPAEFELCELSGEEIKIRDRYNNPPVAKYRVQIGEALDPPAFGSDYTIDIPTAEPGRRVFNALLRGKEPEPKDVQEYIIWKKALQAEIVVYSSMCSLSEVYRENLKEVRYITGDILDDPFDVSNGRTWIKAILGVGEQGGFAKRIDKLPDERVSHTIATFLLGRWLRDRLRLDFIKLPRIFSKNNKVGDSFPFFWTVTCLGHDIGYEFENDKRLDIIKTLADDMTTNYQKLRELLGLSKWKTLLELNRSDLESYGLNDSECNWAERSIRMVQKYYHFRLLEHGCIDHGIAGGMVLFDALREMVDKKNSDRSVSRHEKIGETGFLAANSGHSRFLACSVLVSLTVARHNMWVVDGKKSEDGKQNALQKYKDAGLDDLIVYDDTNKLSFHEPLDQLLYFLDYIDTIDPLKAFYLRSISGINERDGWQKFVTQRIRIGFCRGEIGGNHQIRFHFDTVGLGPDPMPRIISFMETVKGLVGWLQIKEEPIGTRHRIDLYLPVPNRKKHVDYAYGVSEEEILDICFYQGIPDSSRPGIFFQLPNAYQSFNLLMMDGLAGEKIRIGKEHQRPNSIYIRNWKMTLAVFRNVFSAMCKCQYALSDGDSTLHRMDRRLNVEQMYKKRQTIAFTSTTKVELLSKFLEGKNEPVVETLRLQEQIPNFDFQQILKEDYTFTDEAEVLLPPFVKIKSPFDIPLKTSSETFKEMPLYLDLNLGEMAFPPCYRDKNTLIQVLNQLQDKAAETLDYFVSEGANTVYIDEHSCPSYILWKQAFQELVALEFFDIYKGVNASFKRKAFK